MLMMMVSIKMEMRLNNYINDTAWQLLPQIFIHVNTNIEKKNGWDKGMEKKKMPKISRF